MDQIEQTFRGFADCAATPGERDLISWMSDVVPEHCGSREAVAERSEIGQSLADYMRADIIYRLTVQLPEMDPGDGERPRWRAQCRAAAGLARKIRAA